MFQFCKMRKFWQLVARQCEYTLFHWTNAQDGKFYITCNLAQLKKDIGAALRSSIPTNQIWKRLSVEIMTVMDDNPPNTLRILPDKKQIGEKGKFFILTCQLLNDSAHYKDWWMGLWKPSLHNSAVYYHTIISSGLNHQWILKQLLFLIILLVISGIINLVGQHLVTSIHWNCWDLPYSLVHGQLL